MVSSIFKLALVLSAQSAVLAFPMIRHRQTTFSSQAHRGGRGETCESTLPSFANGLMSGVNTLELDNGLTKDGHVIVWHDEDIEGIKCKDTEPAYPGDPEFPYVGKFVANLTLAQIKTLDCCSKRLLEFPLQILHPGTKISTLAELFSFVECVDPKHTVSFNIESKVDPVNTNQTRAPEDFVQLQHELFKKSSYYHKITYQSFYWGTLKGMKNLDPSIPTAALVDDTTLFAPDNTTSPWLGGIDLNATSDVPLGVQLAEAAHKIKADILSPADLTSNSTLDPSLPGYVPFTTKEMIDRAHSLGIKVYPWTVDKWSVAEQLLDLGVDGIITDFPTPLVRLLKAKGVKSAPLKFSEKHVMKCLRKHLQTV